MKQNQTKRLQLNRMDTSNCQTSSNLAFISAMSMTTAVCIFAKKAVRERRIPFELTAEPESSYATKRDVSRRIGAAAGKIVLPANFDQTFAEMDAEIADLFEGNGSL